MGLKIFIVGEAFSVLITHGIKLKESCKLYLFEAKGKAITILHQLCIADVNSYQPWYDI